MIMDLIHQKFMERAIELAMEAEKQGEVPIGAVVVLNNEIIGEGYNQVIKLSDPSAHAEIIALRQAAKKIGNYRLNGASIYTTLEPCCMCAGALVHARIKNLYFSASDPKAGACGSQFQLLDNSILNHRVNIDIGIFQEKSASLLKNFFKERR